MGIGLFTGTPFETGLGADTAHVLQGAFVGLLNVLDDRSSCATPLTLL